MPLHLLGKKSWNVYNPANIERVRRDQAEARRREEENERRELKDAADARLQLLKHEPKETSRISSEQDGTLDSAVSGRGSYNVRMQKRKLPGEDDTDRDIRIARETTSTSYLDASTSTYKRRRSDKEDSLVDANGNISLIPVPNQSEASNISHKSRLEEDPYTVYLSHATGKGKDSGDTPWYSAVPVARPGGGISSRATEPWGDDSPQRRAREAARVSAIDPLAVMKKGVKQLREAEKHRKEWMTQRERDLKEVEDLAREEKEEEERERERADRDVDEHRQRRKERKRNASRNSTWMKGIPMGLENMITLIATAVTGTIIGMGGDTVIIIVMVIQTLTDKTENVAITMTMTMITETEDRPAGRTSPTTAAISMSITIISVSVSVPIDDGAHVPDQSHIQPPHCAEHFAVESGSLGTNQINSVTDHSILF
ncbi:uncharacterized protein Z518_07011 [Rhinocladiella mackenziei CBS 650.93]|uniref:CBF1-interacting co-repressor CIR N-terminal domain-containing protein n=1 Tax=Rhinocladiella mackenziei CBS 650.93 TaxID=1442369 RepID=A0A0D2ICC2_9EURO|nr:uncharacterized protein Z518_07011 [Rhinocladiella mackenziei CBS 650.93]KIX03459.1 hypothetical protein Z518_07011 [Rhinocladiella mackenziei CBS 650.93]